MLQFPFVFRVRALFRAIDSSLLNKGCMLSIKSRRTLGVVVFTSCYRVVVILAVWDLLSSMAQTDEQ